MFMNKFKKSDQPPILMSMSIALLPLRDIVIFPHMVAPLFVGRTKSINALSTAIRQDNKAVFLATQKDASVDSPSEENIYETGTIGTVLQLLKLPDGTVKALIEGKKRARIKHYLPNDSCFTVEVEEICESEEYGPEIEALARNIKNAFFSYARTNKNISSELANTVASIEDPSRLADTVASHFSFKIKDKQRLLETEDVPHRMTLLYELMHSEIEILQIENRIKGRVKKQMEKMQKNYYLNEQMRAIKKEMGDTDEQQSELQELEKRIKRKRMTKEASAKVQQEFKKLKMMAPMSAEATVVRNYIDWILDLPWFDRSKIQKDIEKAEDILDADHYGLEKPKERILEYLAVQSLVKKIRGPILCLVGPPGVGKTSLAQSVARATNRKFIRLSLGGVRDEAEIRGHRRTYIGALPGKVIQSLKKARVNNPVFCLDEVDKMSTDFRGDPSAALLEVLDPEQNCAFCDHYLDIDYNLSEILFITTANTLPNIPVPLQDRMEIIRLPGYTEHEKLRIAKGFLVAKQIKLNGLNAKNLHFSDNSILTIIREYTKEAGVRNLEREIASVCRKVARKVAKKGQDTNILISEQSARKYLGTPRYRHGQVEEKDEVGLSTGLAWTEVGGEILTIETIFMPGKGKLDVTGKLGDVMQESARAALSYVRSRATRLGINPGFYQETDIHIHVPEGAIPKDGPSAGIAIATSIVSALLRKPVYRNVAMTGEITLRGRVLPIGGLKEKILAAHRGRITRVIIPAENKKDLSDIPAPIMKQIEIVLVDHVDEVLSTAIKLKANESIFQEEEESLPEFIPRKSQEIQPDINRDSTIN
ncbi:MAG: endopeptidase La [Deltaproteobacteria bacterium]|jgi:ATP-dependent Lon protease|nr:endopeptidase La [Deltaproteobacteria bacterium]